MPAADALTRAVTALRRGELVAFPTETVYGLGADAANPAALRHLYRVKGRPASHPVIVHVASSSELDAWAADVPEAARRLAAACWPGPLTIVLRRSPRVSDLVTGGRETVGLRVPAAPVARALLQAFGGGIAAPSANRFGRVSPTTAAHVRDDLGRDVAVVLDGGACAIGVESTIVDCSTGEPAVLRPGAVTRERLESLLGHPVRVGGTTAAPGTLPSHYAPRARVVLVARTELDARVEELRAGGRRVEILDPTGGSARAAHDLYDRLRRADARHADVVVAVLPPEEGIGAAVADRLRRAAGPSAAPDTLP